MTKRKQQTTLAQSTKKLLADYPKATWRELLSGE